MKIAKVAVDRCKLQYVPCRAWLRQTKVEPVCSREGTASQLPDHQLQVCWGQNAIVIDIEKGKDRSQPVFPAGPLAAGFQC